MPHSAPDAAPLILMLFYYAHVAASYFDERATEDIAGQAAL